MPSALAGARAREGRASVRPPFVDGRAAWAPDEEGVITLDDLRKFLNHPVKAFLHQRLRLHLTDEDRYQSDDLATTLGGLEHWAVADRLLRPVLVGRPPPSGNGTSAPSGRSPRAGLGDASITGSRTPSRGCLHLANECGVDPAGDERLPVEVGLAAAPACRDGGGTLQRTCPGPGSRHIQQVLSQAYVAAWLDLVALDGDRRRDELAKRCREPHRGAGALLTRSSSLGVASTPAERHDLRTRRARDRRSTATGVGCSSPSLSSPTLSYKLHRGQAGPDDWRVVRRPW